MGLKMNEENKPCPLCGEKAIEGYDEEELKYTFECYPCGLILTGDMEVKETERIWNRRQPHPEIKKAYHESKAFEKIINDENINKEKYSLKMAFVFWGAIRKACENE